MSRQPPMPSDLQAYRASLLWFTGDPAVDPNAVQWHQDGLLIVRDGRVLAAGDHAALRDQLSPGITEHDWQGKLIAPGFIDTHLHYPQTAMIASPASGLLPWLENYTFPSERAFAEPGHAQAEATFFIDELLRCGTTTAMVYCTVHPHSADALFAAAAVHNLRMVAGKVLMDRHCPDFLCETAEQGAADTEALIQRWHGNGRALYAITPRFAPTSSDAQLVLTAELAARYPDTFIQTHVAENMDECGWVGRLYPQARSYLDVYEQAGLLRERAVYGHCIWLDDADFARMAATGAAVAVCPTSNLFLGSGLFDFARADAAGVALSLASDVGAGTTFSILQTMNEAYKVARLKGTHLPGARLFYLATLGAARSMRLEGVVGSLQPGCEADFVVLDPAATPLLAHRTARCANLEEWLFALALLGDDRTVAATYAAGRLVHRRDGGMVRPRENMKA